jgi:hypothetical protein
MTSEPALLALQGRVDHETVEAELDAINERRYPGWQVTYDEIGIELARARQRAVWVIVLEESATRRTEVVKFLLLGGDDEENPLWARIRADSSSPVASD